jgi:MSHA pilin protein MshC
MIGKILKSLALIMIRPSNQSHCRGYTLTELVVVVTVVAILAVVAMPKLMDTSGFSARTGADQLVAAFQFAQTAAQQQDVATAVNVSSSGFSVTQNGSVVQGFSGPYQTALNTGASISPAATIAYGTNGLPSSTGSFTVSGSGSSFNVNVESTGFTHE